MEVGQVVDVHLEPAEAYGERDERLVQTIPLDQLPGAEELSVGQRVMLPVQWASLCLLQSSLRTIQILRSTSITRWQVRLLTQY